MRLTVQSRVRSRRYIYGYNLYSPQRLSREDWSMRLRLAMESFTVPRTIYGRLASRLH